MVIYTIIINVNIFLQNIKLNSITKYAFNNINEDNRLLAGVCVMGVNNHLVVLVRTAILYFTKKSIFVKKYILL